MADKTFDIEYRVKADTTDAEEKLDDLNKKVPGAGGPTSPGGNPVPGSTPPIAPSSPAPSPVTPVPTPGEPGQPKMPGLPEIPGLPSLPALPDLPNLPDLPIGKMAPVLIAGGAAAVAMAAAIGQLAYELANGAKEAANMVSELDGMTSEERAAAIRELGTLGDVLSKNSAILLEYGRNSERAGRKGSDFFQAAGTQFVPILNEIAKAIDSVDTAALGEMFGKLAADVVRATTPLLAFVEAYNNLPKDTQVLIQRSVMSVIPGMGTALMYGALNPPEPPSVDPSMAEAKRVERLTDWNATEARMQWEELPNASPNPIQRRIDMMLRAALLRKEGTDGSTPKGDSDRNREQYFRLRSRLGAMERASFTTTQDTVADTMLQEAQNSPRGGRDARALEFIKDLQGLLDKGVSPELAQRSAIALDRARYDDKAEVSSLAARGGSAGESLAAAASGRDAILDLKRVAELQVDIQKQTTQHVAEIVRMIENGVRTKSEYGGSQ